MTGGGGETAYRLQKLVQACDHLDSFHDRATGIKTSTSDVSISGHEWGLVGIAFSINYEGLAKEVTEHIGMIDEFLSTAEANMEETVLNYEGADQAIIDHIHTLQADPPEFRARK